MKSLIRFFEENVEKYASNIYLWEKLQEKYEGSTYQETRRQVQEFGAGLMQLGIKKGDRVSLLADGRNNWVIGELGILYAGGVNVPLSIKLNPEEIKFRLIHSGSKMVITSSTQAPKILEVIDKCPDIVNVIFMDPREEYSEGQIHFNEVRKIGREWLENPSNRKVFEDFTASISASDPANICYTSGTTADPKGIILTHGNYVTNVYQSYSLMDIPQHYKTLLILPWDHSFAHTAGLYAFMGKGASIASVKVGKTPMETLRNIPICMKEIKPNLLMSVPALAKNFRKNIEKGIREKGRMSEAPSTLPWRWHTLTTKRAITKGAGYRSSKSHFLTSLTRYSSPRCVRHLVASWTSSSEEVRFLTSNCSASSMPLACRCTRVTVSQKHLPSSHQTLPRGTSSAPQVTWLIIWISGSAMTTVKSCRQDKKVR